MAPKSAPDSTAAFECQKSCSLVAPTHKPRTSGMKLHVWAQITAQAHSCSVSQPHNLTVAQPHSLTVGFCRGKYGATTRIRSLYAGCLGSTKCAVSLGSVYLECLSIWNVYLYLVS